MAACALQSGSEATPSTPRSDATRLAAARANHATATETAATELAERMPSLPWEAPLPFGYAPSATRSSPSGTRSSFGFTQTLPPRAASGLLPVTPKAAAAVEPVRRPNPLGEAVGADGSGDGGGGDGDGDSDSDDGGSDSGDDTGQGEGAKLVGSGTGDLFGPRGFCCGGGGGGGGGAATSTDRAGGGGGARPGLGLGMGLRLGGASLKLDLRSLSVPEVVGDRPDEVGRAPPTPTAAIVERLRAEATALAGHQAGHQAAMSPAAAMPPAAAMAGPSLTRALSEMSVADISSALAATNRSLLSGMGASWAVDASEIRFRERLGAGAYGEVFAAEWRRSRVAVKRLLCTVDDRSVQQFYTEMEILANARHDNIVRFLGGCVQPDSLCILLEFCPRSLYDLLRQSQEALPLSQVLRTARQVAGGLYYLHCCTPPVRRLDLRPTSPTPLSPPSHSPLTPLSPPSQVLHLDLKSANVLLDEHGVAKVCDFGLAHLKLGSGVNTSRHGSPSWTAPEVLKGEARDEKADTYSYGMLLFELMTRELPFNNVSPAQVVMGVITNLLPRPTLPNAKEWPEALRELMERCWQHAPGDRPAFGAILDTIERIAEDAGVAL